MKRQFVFALLPAFTASLWASYSYDYSQNPVIADSSRWRTNGSVSFASYGATFPGGGGSLISVPAISGTPGDYEVNSTLALKSAGGTYIEFLRADSTSVTAGSGSYTSVELVIPTGFVSPGAATLNINQCVSGTVTQIASQSTVATDGMAVRSIIFGTTLFVLFDNQLALEGQVSAGGTGNPGIGGSGIPAESGFSGIRLGHHDEVAPGVVDSRSVFSSVLPNSVLLRWPGVVDDPNGAGLFYYWLQRDGAGLSEALASNFTDNTLQPSTTYDYQIAAVDFHGNYAWSNHFTVTTPPAQAVDPRRVGVLTTGNYWGGGGEQIDTLSGNLNFTVPLLAAQGRDGWAVPVALSYNSQNWRQDGGANWRLGNDVGYGFGWRVGVGSLTPYYIYWWDGPDHYVFTDSTGAEYRLDVNTGGVWSSKQGIYVWFDANTNILHFKDGTFWVMGCAAGGTENDAGSLYPTTIEDSNGNQVILVWQTGTGLPSGTLNTSSRIGTIQDVRSSGPSSPSYTFSYDSVSYATPHLTGIANAIGTSETYSFTYDASHPSEPPFGPDPAFGDASVHLATVTVSSGGPFQFSYDSAGAAELTSAKFPLGGLLSWNYVTFAYSGNRRLREVGARYVAADSAGATQWGPYTFSHDDSANPNPTVHANTTLVDASGVGAKTWSFFTPNNTSLAWQIGLVSQFVQSASPGGTVLSRNTSTWAQDGALNPYVSTAQTTLDESSPNPQTTKTTQTLDQYGNVTQAQVYDYNSLTTPVRTYTNTWLHTGNSSYPNAYIRNRLLASTVTDNQNHTVTMVSNTYDGGSLTAVSGTPAGFDAATYTTGYHTRGNVTQKVVPGATTSYTYDVTGHALTGADATGTGATLTYSSTTNFAAPGTAAPTAGNPDVQNGHSVSQASGSQLQSGYTYNNALALVQSAMPNSATASQNFNSSTGLLTSSVSVHGATTNYTYTFTPNIVTASTNSHWMKAYKDGFGRDAAGEAGYGTTIVSHSDTVYAPCACSPLGKVSKTSLPYAIGAGGQITASDGTGNIGWTTYAYDGVGRTLTTTAPDGSATHYVYLGNTTKVTDPAGN
jgi:hypothetical protein